MSSKFKIQNSKFKVGNRQSAVRVVLFLLLTAYCLPLAVSAHEGEDHSEAKPATATTTTAMAASIARAERNIESEAGNFNFKLERFPADPRTGELVQIALRLAEKVEGGFGTNEPVVIEDAAVSLNVTNADGAIVAENIPATFEQGFYKADYEFSGAGNFKFVFLVTTKDNRQVFADFPVSVTNAPVRWTFWLGLLILGVLSFGTVGLVFYKVRDDENRGRKIKRLAPLAALAVIFFAFGTFALAYFAPPRQTRVLGAFNPTGETANTETANPNLLASLTIPKESQILFGIKTEPVETRNITAGLKTTGTVKAKPDAQAIVTPPVSGRIVLKAGLTIGSAVGRGERIGYVEQVLDVSGQTELESQRLEVEAQQREIEARRLEIKNSVLQLQAQQAEQRAKANQARTQLAQAEREQRRAENLVEVNAVPRKRLEEAQTAVKVAEQEVASAEQQVKLLDNQIKQTNAGQNIFRAPKVNQPNKTFPLTAPVTGLISEIKATSGQQIEAGTEILSIVNLNTVLIEAQVFERDLPAVRDSTKASFTNAALSGEIYTAGTPDGDGRLVSVGQTVDPNTRTVSVIYEVKNPLNRLRDGMFVEITIDTTGDREILAVPKEAVITEQGQTFVFVFDGGETFEKRAVALGTEGADYYEVKTGLKSGERVVTEGIYQLRSTQPTA